MSWMKSAAITLALVFLASCTLGTWNKDGVETMAMKITSPAFQHMGIIPAKYTCQGQDTSPALRIDGIPQGARTLALIMDDPDAPMGTWDHWVMWNIPINESSVEIAEGSAPPGAVEGLNSWPKKGYGGPCPPSGVHRYFFRAYALDTALSISGSAGKKELETAMVGHALAKAELIGKYSRK